jgi:hypothetical protein
MSDIPYADRLNLAELVARIERQNEETHKFVAEAHKLEAERAKLYAEQGKLDAEQGKYYRETFLAPLALAVTAIGAGAALFAGALAFLKYLG